MILQRFIIGAILGGFAATVFWASGPVMRETDQASLIDGAWQLRQGKSPVAPGFYAYDKQFLTYAWLAAFVPETEAPLDESAIRAVVDRANLAAGFLFVAGVIGFVFLAGGRPGDPRGFVVPLVAFLTAPVILLSSSLASSAIVSAGFLLLLCGVLAKRRFRGQIFLAGLLAFLATGARADAALCMPIICWATIRSPRWNALLREPRHWAMAAGSLAALAAGYFLAGEVSPAVYEAVFDPEIFGAFLLFGLGGLLLVDAGLGMMTAVRVFRNRGFWLAGAGFLMLPLLFYGWQLFSPRHLMTFAIALFAAATGWHGRAWSRAFRQKRPIGAPVFASVVVGFSVAPLVVGLHLPIPERASFVTSDSTRYPSADGLWPMGATADFLRQLRNSGWDSEPVDHNQEIWNAAIDDRIQWPESKSVSILHTPMRQYLALALRLRGREPNFHGPDSKELPADVPIVSDERSLHTRVPGRINGAGLRRYESWLATFDNASFRTISPPDESQPILSIDKRAKGSPSKRFTMRRIIAEEIGHEDVRFERQLSAGESFQLERKHEGKTIVLSGSRPFSVNGSRTEPSGDASIFVFVADGRLVSRGQSFHLEDAGPVSVWSTQLPAFMSRRQFRQDRDIAANPSPAPTRPRETSERSGSSGARDVSAR